MACQLDACYSAAVPACVAFLDLLPCVIRLYSPHFHYYITSPSVSVDLVRTLLSVEKLIYYCQHFQTPTLSYRLRLGNQVQRSSLQPRRATSVMAEHAVQPPTEPQEEPVGMEEEAQLLTSWLEVPNISKCWLRSAQGGGLNLTVCQ